MSQRRKGPQALRQAAQRRRRGLGGGDDEEVHAARRGPQHVFDAGGPRALPRGLVCGYHEKIDIACDIMMHFMRWIDRWMD